MKKHYCSKYRQDIQLHYIQSAAEYKKMPGQWIQDGNCTKSTKQQVRLFIIVITSFFYANA